MDQAESFKTRRKGGLHTSKYIAMNEKPRPNSPGFFSFSKMKLAQPYSNWRFRSEVEGGILFNVATHELAWLNDTAAFVLAHWTIGHTVEAIATEARRAYEVGPDIITDIKETIDSLTQFLSGSTKSVDEIDIVVERPPSARLVAPIRVFVTLSRRCNLVCKHCYNESGPNHQSTLAYNEVQKLLADADELGVFEVVLSGGEPLLVPYIGELLADLDQRAICVSLLTNGTILPTNARSVIEMTPPSRIQVSLDGNRSIHDSIRGKGTYDVILKNLATLTEIAPVQVSTTKTGLLTETAFEELLGDLKRTGVKTLSLNRLSVAGRGATVIAEDRGVDYEHIASQYDFQIETEPQLFKASECAAGRSIVSVNETGDVFPCSFLQTTDSCCIGNVRQKTLKEIWINQTDDWRREHANSVQNGCICDQIAQSSINRVENSVTHR